MNPAECLKLTTAKSINLNRTGGMPDLTWEDIAAALSRITNPAARALIAAKYAYHEGDITETRIYLYRSFMDRFPRAYKTTGHRPGMVLNVCHMLVFEAVDPLTCHTCHGRAEAVVDSLKVVCEACRGSGKARLDYQLYLGLTDGQWKHWEQVLHDARAILTGWEIEGLSEIANYLQNHQE